MVPRRGLAILYCKANYYRAVLAFGSEHSTSSKRTEGDAHWAPIQLGRTALAQILPKIHHANPTFGRSLNVSLGFRL